MKLYLLTQDVNNGYDTYDSCIVCAENEEEAKRIPPSQYTSYNKEINDFDEDNYSAWVSSVKYIKCLYIGEASNDLEKGLVLASFNAG